MTNEERKANNFSDRSHSINVLLSKTNNKSVLHNDIVLAKID